MAVFKDPSPSRSRTPFESDKDGTRVPGDRKALAARAAVFPHEPGVYLWRDKKDEVLYVGKAVDLRNRVRSYLSGAHEARTEAMVDEATDVEFIATHTEKEALILEQTLIKKERPRYNVRLTDDKKYPYIKVTDERYPRVVYTRDLTRKGTYFGPFPDAWAAKSITRLLNATFQLRQCRTLPDRACIYHQMGQCLAPCIDAVPDSEYKAAADAARGFLKGQGEKLVKGFETRMKTAAEAERFEEAARLRDTAAAIRSVLERQRVFAAGQEDRDVVGFARSGDRACCLLLFVRDGKTVGREYYFLANTLERSDADVVEAFLTQYYAHALAVPREVVLPVRLPEAELLSEWLSDRRGGGVRFTVPERGDKLRLVEMAMKNAGLLAQEDHFKRERERSMGVEALHGLLKLERPPRTIDGFDISHHGGDHTVASMVRFLNGLPHKEMYRRYKIRHVAGIDDFAAMREAVKRRFEGLVERGDELPDLVMVDGGRGQLRAAVDALKELGLEEQPVCSLAKREEEIFLPLRLHPIRAPARHEGRQLLERVRNEAHRFAIKYQENLKGKALTRSRLLSVPGVGPERLRRLLRRFGSLEGIAAASLEELCEVPGVTQALASRIQDDLVAWRTGRPSGDLDVEARVGAVDEADRESGGV
ncbi:MAG: excinuclease ABC subunit UvrC [Euryarchaeota archaeon]|nr:excinuclease ABC subunit UvrC [Euryarchaeota archaeon]